MTDARQVWIDVHAHPGRPFLAGLDDSDPLARLLGGQDVAAALAAARRPAWPR